MSGRSCADAAITMQTPPSLVCLGRKWPFEAKSGGWRQKKLLVLFFVFHSFHSSIHSLVSNQICEIVNTQTKTNNKKTKKTQHKNQKKMCGRSALSRSADALR